MVLDEEGITLQTVLETPAPHGTHSPTNVFNYYQETTAMTSTTRAPQALSISIDEHYQGVTVGDCNKALFVGYLVRVLERMNMHPVLKTEADAGYIEIEVLGRLLTLFKGEGSVYEVTHNYGVSVVETFNEMLEVVCFPILAKTVYRAGPIYLALSI